MHRALKSAVVSRIFVHSALRNPAARAILVSILSLSQEDSPNSLVLVFADSKLQLQLLGLSGEKIGRPWLNIAHGVSLPVGDCVALVAFCSRQFAKSES